MLTTAKLSALRQKMADSGVQGFIQPVQDEYLNEYPPACNRRVEWLTGFSGSAGTAVVLRDKAALFIDGRYTLQAAAQTDSALFQQFNSSDTAHENWLADECASALRVGYDPRLTTQAMLKRLGDAVAAKQVQLVPVANMIDAIWQDRPAQPATPVFTHEVRYSGEDAAAKRQRLAHILREQQVDAVLITAPDAVGWLFNIRARDVEHTPFLLARALLFADGRAQLFLDPTRVDAAVQTHLGKDVILCPPAQFETSIQHVRGKRVLCDPASAPVWFAQALAQAGATVVEKPDPCLLAKAIKNPVELQGMRNAHTRDGAALCRLLCWLEREVGQRAVTEIDVAEKLLSFRAADPLFLEPSFATIAGSGAHGAIVHYHATQTSNRALREGELFLLDSGGQYFDGTTDVTRTLAIGTPSSEHKERFTLVLKGHIALARTNFPAGTSGSQLDVLARHALWQAQLDYDHGTGHGVGHFACVHEGPQRISKRGGDAALKPGMILSNEPGYYKDGEYGIRIENLVMVVERAKSEGGKSWLGFETITCVPIDTRLVNAALLSAHEIAWLNTYHAWVKEQLTPRLDVATRDWLAERCAAI